MSNIFTPKSTKIIEKSNFATEINGKSIRLYKLKNINGVEITITNFGLKLVSLYVPDRDGKLDDIVLGFSSIKDYLHTDEIYFGATIGRYGNRIAKGKFSINGTEYVLDNNNGNNHLHGGTNGFHNLIWDAEVISDTEIQFTRISKDMEEGYPGNLDVRVHYQLTDSNELKINYYATTDKTTIVNMTHHSYFNLSGEGNGTINNHILTINADRFTPVNYDHIPTGELAPVAHTPFDFRNPKVIGTDIKSDNEQLTISRGYDHNFVLNDYKNKDTLIVAAKITDPSSGRVMEVFTNEPGLQFYGGNFLTGKTIGKSDKPYTHRSAFCLETQHFPDSPNQPNFPCTLLKPESTYRSTCIYKFFIG